MGEFGFPVAAGKAAYDEAKLIAEGERQTDLAAGTCQAECVAADTAYYRKLVSAALANGMPAAGSLQALASLGAASAPSELIVRTDTAPFTLVGGRYLVEITATFAEGGLVELSDGATYASFTETGSSAVVDLRPGTYAFVLTGATDFTGTVSDTPYI
jgi:hypothetical protein